MFTFYLWSLLRGVPTLALWMGLIPTRETSCHLPQMLPTRIELLHIM